MPNFLKKGSQVADVLKLQELLAERGYLIEATGIFDQKTVDAVKAFQSQNLDQHGQPLVVDGQVGPLTWWSLTHPKPEIKLPLPVNFTIMPPVDAGGSPRGRAGLEVAIRELNAGAGEIGGNNLGPYVLKYLHELATEGSHWCAGFVSWCFSQIPGGIPFDYCVGARDILAQFKAKGWSIPPQIGYEPLPGDLVIWWQVSAQHWKGHIGIVYQLLNGMLYTIEGNKSPKVQGFSYVFSRMEKLLGYGHIPE